MTLWSSTNDKKQVSSGLSEIARRSKFVSSEKERGRKKKWNAVNRQAARETPMMWDSLKYNIAFFMEKRLDGKD